MDRLNSTPHRRSYNDPGHAHELTFNCYHRHKFLSTDRTCQWLAEAIAAARAKLDFSHYAYVFMPEHVHLIVCPRQPIYSTSAILKTIKEPVGRQAIAYLEEQRPEWLPRLTRERRGRTERLFWQSGGGFDRNITEPRTLQLMIDYIHENPVRRGLVRRAADWKWSSAPWHDGSDATALIPDRIPPEWTAARPYQSHRFLPPSGAWVSMPQSS